MIISSLDGRIRIDFFLCHVINVAFKKNFKINLINPEKEKYV